IVTEVETLVDRVREFARGERRTILGIAGQPGGGKSTLEQTLVAAVGSAAVLVPMDGFHLAQAELVRLGRRDRMGAPDTFDALGYIALLRRLRDRGEEVVYAPEFRREMDEPWAGVRLLLDECWYADLDEATRLRWLIQRHVDFGKPREAAEEWVRRSD